MQLRQSEENPTPGSVHLGEAHVPEASSCQDTTDHALAPAELDALFRQLHGNRVRRRLLAGLNTGLKWTAIANVATALGMFAFNLITTAGHARLAVDLRDWGGLVNGHTLQNGEVVVSLGGAWIFLWALIIGGYAGVRIYTRRQRQLSRDLPHIHDPRVLSPLLDTLTLGDEDFRMDIAPPLVALLRELTPKDTLRLSGQDRETLHAEVKKGNGELRYAALQALKQVGTSFDVECLAPILEDERDPARQEELRQCIDAIKARSGVEKARERLLRPSDAAEDDTLLRAASSPGSADPSTLLRPS